MESKYFRNSAIVEVGKNSRVRGAFVVRKIEDVGEVARIGPGGRWERDSIKRQGWQLAFL